MLLKKIIAASLLINLLLTANAQDSTVNTKAVVKDTRFTFGGLLLTRYVQSLDKHVDINGKHYAADDGYTTSSLFIRKARVLAKAQVNAKLEATVLINLSDFSDPKNKVLEIASMQYKYNDFLQLQVGQFRPYFGLEDLYPEDFLKSLDWSNQYYAFGNNGWQSFQVGVTVYGEWKNELLPVKYYLGMFNGNGKNQLSDNDNGKLFPARMELVLGKKTKLGLNAGTGKERSHSVWAVNADIDHTIQFNKHWSLEIQSEYKKGTNTTTFFAQSSDVDQHINDFVTEGYYILPNLKYQFEKKQVKSIELSCRYENLDCDVKRNGNIRQSFMPMLSTQFAEDYNLRFQLGMMIDKYERQVVNSTQYNGNRFVCQLQARL